VNRNNNHFIKNKKISCENDFWGFIEYMHVGCTMHNEECHLAYCLFYPKFEVGDRM
jgi:hypothetical protein